ncbi:DegT/DnrJ/EryC1/StrS family aminotransferase [Methyloprofundus sp.]|uniref:DegT/DnrJ/EryC1/StrS family aminotransferase n=1 Tax=Methyloprofundus sp. TaxID=2020875 RepID=UPI003D10090D
MILNYGDISILSFHATKLFHTIEGGALIINDDSLVEKARYLINFGIENAESIPELGTNAKMNEFEAAMGLCMLDEMEVVSQKRKDVYERYQKELGGMVQLQKQNSLSTQNYSYFPIILNDEEERLKVQHALNHQNISPRRYFYPSLDTLNYIEPKQHCAHSRDLSKRILCLPMYPELSEEDQMKVTSIIQSIIRDSL